MLLAQVSLEEGRDLPETETVLREVIQHFQRKGSAADESQSLNILAYDFIAEQKFDDATLAAEKTLAHSQQEQQLQLSLENKILSARVEVSGISFDQRDGVNILKGYRAAGEFSRGKESIRASGGIVMVGNFDVDVEQQQRVGHLLSPLPPEMRNDTAFMDRIHAYAPGWDFPKLKADEHLTDHFGLVTDYLSERWTKVREGTRISTLQVRAHWGGALSGRDIEAVSKTVNGLLKLLFPDPDMPISDQELEGVLRIALEARRRVKEQQKRCLKTEFRNTHFSYFMGVEGVEQFVSTPELHSDEAIEADPLPPGQVWAISPGGQDAAPSLLLFHDLRRTGARNLRRAGVAEGIIMKIGGWRTRSVFERHAIVSRSDMNDAILKLQASENRVEQ